MNLVTYLRSVISRLRELCGLISIPLRSSFYLHPQNIMRPHIIGPVIGITVMVVMAVVCWKIDTSISTLFICLALITVVAFFLNRKRPSRNSDSSVDAGGGWFGDSGAGSHGHGHHDGAGFDGGGHGCDGGGGGH
jgi:uncharacterized membrane protein YgcG